MRENACDIFRLLVVSNSGNKRGYSKFPPGLGRRGRLSRGDVLGSGIRELLR